MQSIAEEVVSSSGGGGTYITSGFSNYVGHSAIGFGCNTYDAAYSAVAIAIGIINSNSEIDGILFCPKRNGMGIEEGSIEMRTRTGWVDAYGMIVF